MDHHSSGIGTMAPAIELRNVSKRYGKGTLANESVSFTIERGEIHAICGENGAGKSTIMKMIYGLIQPTSGTILVDGVERNFSHPRQAIAAGVGMVAQHLNLVSSFTIAENVVLGQEPVGKGGLLDREAAVVEVKQLAMSFGLDIDPTARVGEVSIGMQQRTEILKTLYRGARILLMDEPTAVLTPQETDELFAAIRRLAASGVTVVVITHKLAEVKAISDRLTVLRDGRVTGQANTADIDHRTIAEMMVGRLLAPQIFQRVEAMGRQPRVRVRHLGFVNAQGSVRLSDVNFDVAGGEILGIAGVEGNGQNSLARVLSGLSAPHAGRAELDGAQFTGTGVRAARTSGVATVAEDRLAEGVAANLDIEQNIAATSYFEPSFSAYGCLKTGAIGKRANDLIKEFDVKTASSKTPVGTLSGGNMQKVVMAREISGEPKFLIAAQPTRGVDIGAAGSLRDQLVALRDRGAAVLLISADLEEVLSLSDRIAVLFKGEIVAHFRADTADQREIGLYMTGLKRQPFATAKLEAAFAADMEGVLA
ncbi:ABC transporter ATP-binding protein [Rhizobium sp. 2YAF20]|uniref:ABC transporter ATP-binding protein n=1 Tax=Rhizobium sp. 2YAF20 TaxID=3233027 RepID=UPI003F9D9042